MAKTTDELGAEVSSLRQDVATLLGEVNRCKSMIQELSEACDLQRRNVTAARKTLKDKSDEWERTVTRAEALGLSFSAERSGSPLPGPVVEEIL